MNPLADRLRAILRLVMATDPVEIDCDGFLARVSAFLEARQRGDEIPPELRAVSQHLEVCPECKEEFEALLRTHGV